MGLNPVKGIRAVDFDATFRAHRGVVYRYLFRLSGSRTVAEDLTQECFLRFWEGVLGRRSLRNPRAWLLRVATNLHRDRIRRTRAWPREVLLPAPEPESPGVAPDQALLEKERARLARSALSSLRERDRVILLLRFTGLSYSEIAEATGLRRSSVGRLLERAARRFAEAYRSREEASR